MGLYLGIDTSNYTTSAALYDRSNDILRGEKQLLPVREGELGLRQSDAVFHHVRQLPEIVEKLMKDGTADIDGVAASDRPRQVEGSYMPCFLAGSGLAREFSALLSLPLHLFTHQQGHVAAAAYGAGRFDLLREPFLAFHVSGGTTDALLVQPDDEVVIRCETVACSLDLKAGQLIDRVGGMLGLPFPAGPRLDLLAQKARGSYRPRPALKDGCCSLSGVENQCRGLKDRGGADEEIALFCLESVWAALDGMTRALRERFGPLPLLYAGGVMSNTLLKHKLSQEHGGLFAPPDLSADNACGIALLCAVREEGWLRASV